MTQTVETPDKEDNQDTHELSESGPMWEKIAQLIGDEELAREVFDQLKDAIQSSAIQNALSTDMQSGFDSRGRLHVGRTARRLARYVCEVGSQTCAFVGLWATAPPAAAAR